MRHIKNLNVSIFSLIILLSITIDAQAAKVYKWVDETGRAHYSQYDPNKQDSETVRIKPANTSESPATVKKRDIVAEDKDESEDSTDGNKDNEKKENAREKKDRSKDSKDKGNGK
ncbi:MAG: hypothetical protein BMS9Abin26_2159 [Gammaproteobacteria bacterium]|nr:MAG: hypothetical protein BMS9Abin26_2159 [Gammaproteobacteria bacterium]